MFSLLPTGSVVKNQSANGVCAAYRQSLFCVSKASSYFEPNLQRRNEPWLSEFLCMQKQEPWFETFSEELGQRHIFAEKHTSRTMKSHSSADFHCCAFWIGAFLVWVEAVRVPGLVWFAICWGALRVAAWDDPRCAMPFLIAARKAPQVIVV